ncbi:MAG TPA: hypothetical protein VGP20_10375 [Steroidobacteraceae bacterium]|jgi:hypothetical protein|nr:hypothetical protein [Steroidobacteraceae bacterium]
MSEYRGGCHCGALHYRYVTDLSPGEWPVRACQCSFCRLHSATTTSDPAGSLSFSAADAAPLQRYRFGGRTADFLICCKCGAYLGATVKVDAARFGLVNLRTLRPIPQDLPAPIAMHYDGESVDARLSRRAARWTPLLAGSL